MEKLEFVRTEDGDVSVLIDGEAHVINADAWCSIVASVSHAGEEHLRWYVAKMFHNGVSKVAGLIDAGLHLKLTGTIITGVHTVTGTEANGSHQEPSPVVPEPVKPEPVLAPAPTIEDTPGTDTGAVFDGSATAPTDKTTAEALLDKKD